MRTCCFSLLRSVTIHDAFSGDQVTRIDRRFVVARSLRSILSCVSVDVSLVDPLSVLLHNGRRLRLLARYSLATRLQGLYRDCSNPGWQDGHSFAKNLCCCWLRMFWRASRLIVRQATDGWRSSLIGLLLPLAVQLGRKTIGKTCLVAR